MMTTTETILLITVWTLTVCGLFFGGRARLRKHRLRAEELQTKGTDHQE